MQLNEVKNFIEELDQDKVTFDTHFYKRAGDRQINESMIRSFLSQSNKLEKIEQGKDNRFKLWFKMSRKYSLVVIIEIEASKALKVISTWNTDRRWQGKLKQ